MMRSLSVRTSPDAELLENVVHAGDGEVRVGGLLALTVGVEGFAEGADAVCSA